MKKAVCVGAVNVDILMYVDNFCEDDSEEVVDNVYISSGGQAGNIAAGIGKLGGNSVFFGNIGSDSHTKMIKEDFDNCNVDYSNAIPTSHNNTVYGIINSAGDRRLYAYNKADFSSEDFSDEMFEGVEIIVFASLVKKDAIDIYVDIAKRAKKKGIKIALDPGNIFAVLGMEELSSLIELSDYFFPSKHEVEVLVGSMDNISKLTDLAENVIVTCGKENTILFRKDEEEKVFDVKPLGDKKVVDTTGAGDCFAAAVVYSLLQDKSIEDSILFGTRAATLSVTKKGARGMPTLEEVEVFMDE